MSARINYKIALLRLCHIAVYGCERVDCSVKSLSWVLSLSFRPVLALTHANIIPTDSAL